MVERVVVDIDEIVCLEGFSGRQCTLVGERESNKALRKSCFNHTPHLDEALLEKGSSYKRQHYQESGQIGQAVPNGNSMISCLLTVAIAYNRLLQEARRST
jgi:hypothetical protein